MKVNELFEQLGHMTNLYIPNRYADELDDMMDGNITLPQHSPGNNEDHYFNNIEDVHKRLPKATIAFRIFTNPNKDYRAMQSQSGYDVYPDFEIWFDGRGGYLFYDKLGEEDFYSMDPNAVQQILKMSVQFKNEAELLRLLRQDKDRPE